MFSQSTGFRFWVQWVLINISSLAASFALAGLLKDINLENYSYFVTNSPNVVDCVAGGLLLGVAQWLSLKRLIPNLSYKWIAGSLIALPVSVLLSLTIHKFLIWFYFFNHPSSIMFSALLLGSAGFVGGIMGGVIAGLVQQTVLKQHVQPVSLVVLLLANMIGSAIGWAASWSTAFYADNIAINFYQIESQVIELAVLGIVFGLVNGAIVGGGLVWVLLRPRLFI
ncbi:MAG TPA: hypothetical protein V6C78_33375 [Crinalium sp.]|jgi:hypothetical protein